MRAACGWGEQCRGCFAWESALSLQVLVCFYIWETDLTKRIVTDITRHIIGAQSWKLKSPEQKNHLAHGFPSVRVRDFRNQHQVWPQNVADALTGSVSKVCGELSVSMPAAKYARPAVRRPVSAAPECPKV